MVEVKKSSTSDSSRRPLRIFQKTDHAGEEKDGTFTTSASGKEAVCELIGRKAFIDTVQTINPGLTTKEVTTFQNSWCSVSPIQNLD